MPALTQAQIKQANQTFFDWLQDPGMQKEAADAINEFTRTRIREDGITRRIMPFMTISNDELDRQYYTELPIKIVDKEPDIPPAVSVPYGSLPINWYIRGPRYQVGFQRILSPNFTKDIAELRTWTMDIRQVVTDNSLKDLLAEEDTKFINAVNTALVGQGSITPLSGVAQWQQIVGGITRDSFKDALAILPQTPFHLESATVLLNNVTVYQLEKWGRDEAGGDVSQEMLVDGFAKRKFSNRDMLVTIKRDLVPDNTMFFFAPEKFIGKSFEIDPATLYIERKFYYLTYFTYEEVGSTIGHTGSLSRVDFV